MQAHLGDHEFEQHHALFPGLSEMEHHGVLRHGPTESSGKEPKSGVPEASSNWMKFQG
jgi:hypothetical protein